jgi:Tfp pilus assembly protein PilP
MKTLILVCLLATTACGTSSREQWAAALNGMSQNMQAQQQQAQTTYQPPTYRAPIITDCQRYGNHVSCMSY